MTSTVRKPTTERTPSTNLSLTKSSSARPGNVTASRVNSGVNPVNPRGVPKVEVATETLRGKAIKSGWLYKRGGGRKSKAWKRRYFMLVAESLHYFKTDRERKQQGTIELREYQITEAPDELTTSTQYPFMLRNKKENERSYVMFASTEQERLQWTEILRSTASGNESSKRAIVDIEERLAKKGSAIPSSDLEWEDTVIGGGSSGSVRKAKWLNSAEVAVKYLNDLTVFDEGELLNFYKEIDVLSELRHPEIVEMFGYCKKEGVLCLVTTYVKGGNLSDLIHNKERKLSDMFRIELCMSLCRGMVFLHKRKIIHRDLKPANILIENIEKGLVKVCDFGLSIMSRGNDANDVRCYGTPAYAAPELPEQHDEKVDVYSFAVVLWELWTQEQPWSQYKYSYQIAEAIQKDERPEISPDCPAKDLIQRCWATSPTLRPTFEEIFDELGILQRKIWSENELLGRSQSTLQLTKPEEVYSSQYPSGEGNGQSPQELILSAFNDAPHLPWNDFSAAVCAATGGTPEQMMCIQKWVSDRGFVQLEKWKKFIQWFSPLVFCPTVEYANVSDSRALEGHTIAEVVSVVGNPWFRGEMTAPEAKMILDKQDVGSWLIRFSSSPGLYALSVNYGPVGHWRIAAEKTAGKPTEYLIEKRRYASIQEIIYTHEREPLQTKTDATCLLKQPYQANVTYEIN